MAKIEVEELKETLKTGIHMTEFHATWCQDCIYIKPLYTQLKKSNPQISCIDIDVDVNPTMRQEFKIQRIPTFITFKDGVEIDRIFEPKYEQLETFFNAASKL